MNYSSSNYEDLYQWLDQYKITRPKRNINRDFSDAIPLVEILKQHYPKMVETHNYSPKNSYAEKLINWQTLNRKILSKLKLNVDNTMLERLSKSEQGAIQTVLLNIKEMLEMNAAGEEEAIKAEITAAELVTKLEADISEKDEAIHTLKNKLDHLESLLKIKEERIKDLTQQMQTMQSQLEKATKATYFPKFF